MQKKETLLRMKAMLENQTEGVKKLSAYARGYYEGGRVMLKWVLGEYENEL